ncbi:conserved phage C-terminal domain-containing protein [Proteus mirabilis]
MLDYFNQLTNSKFQSTEPILKALNTIKAKGECYTADEIKLVMEWAVKTWTKGKGLKPQNLCRMTRFDGYLSDALKWKNRDGINPVDCPHEELIKIWNKYVPERAIDFHEWTSRRPAYKDLEAVWNGKTNKGQWREVKHMDTCFKLISQSSLFTGLQDKGWLTLDWILTPTRWSQTYEQAKREYTERKKRDCLMENKFTDYYSEQAVIGGILISTSETEEIAISAIESLVADDFTSSAHKAIFKAMQSLVRNGSKVDLVLLNGEIEQQGNSDITGGFGYLAECTKNTSSIQMLPGYVQKIKDLTTARKTLAVLNEGIAKISSSNVSNLVDVVGEVQSSISSMDTGSVVETQHIMDGVNESINILESMINGDIWKYKTQFGLPDIDKAFGGFNNTDLIVVGTVLVWVKPCSVQQYQKQSD